MASTMGAQLACVTTGGAGPLALGNGIDAFLARRGAPPFGATAPPAGRGAFSAELFASGDAGARAVGGGVDLDRTGTREGLGGPPGPVLLPLPFEVVPVVVGRPGAFSSHVCIFHPGKSRVCLLLPAAALVGVCVATDMSSSGGSGVGREM